MSLVNSYCVNYKLIIKTCRQWRKNRVESNYNKVLTIARDISNLKVEQTGDLIMSSNNGNHSESCHVKEVKKDDKKNKV